MIQITKSMAFRIVSKANWRFFKLTYWGIFEAERTTGKNSQRVKIQPVKALDINELQLPLN